MDFVRPTLSKGTTKSLIVEVAEKEPIISGIYSFDERDERKITSKGLKSSRLTQHWSGPHLDLNKTNLYAANVAVTK